MTGDRDPDVRIVRGEVVEPGDPAGPAGTGAAGGGPGPLTSTDPWADGSFGRIDVRTYDLRGPALPGGPAVWIGAILVGLGAYLVLSATFPAVAAAGSAVVVAIGAALLVLGLSRRRGAWAVYVGAVVLAGGVAGLGQALGVLLGGGWTTLAVGVAFVALSAWRAGRGAGGRSLAVVGGILVVVGAIQAAGSVIPGFPGLGQLLVPAVLVGIGVLVLWRAVRRR